RSAGVPQRGSFSRARRVRIQCRASRRRRVDAGARRGRRPARRRGQRHRGRARLRGRRRRRAVGGPSAHDGGARARRRSSRPRRGGHERPRARRPDVPRRTPGRPARSGFSALVRGHGRNRGRAHAARRAGRRVRREPRRAAGDRPRGARALQSAVDDRHRRQSRRRAAGGRGDGPRPDRPRRRGRRRPPPPRGPWRPLAAAAVLAAVGPLLVILRTITALAAAVPGAVLYLPAPGPAAIVTYAAALGAALAAWHWRTRRRRSTALAAAAVLALLAAIALGVLPILTRGDGRLRVTVLPVGQGDARFVEAPDDIIVVVVADNGGTWRLDAGGGAVAPFLWKRGVFSLHATITTHDDIDHAGGMPALRRLFRVAETWDEARGAHGLGGVLLTPIAPDVPGGRGDDQAIMLRVELGLASIRWPSDVEAAASQALPVA